MFARTYDSTKSWLPSMYGHDLVQPVFASEVGGLTGNHAERRRDPLGSGPSPGRGSRRCPRSTQPHFIAARPNDLLAALNVRLFMTMSLFASVAYGVYVLPLVTKSQWISSASTTTRRLVQISPSLVEILARPAVAGRVLRIAENQRVGVVADASFQIVEIHRVAAVRRASAGSLRRGIRRSGCRRRTRCSVGVCTRTLLPGRRERPQRRDERGVDAGGDRQLDRD